MTDVILAAGMRTPFGDFGKSLKDMALADLGVHAARATPSRTCIASATSTALPKPSS